eukprot:scaffold1863_cov381-Prasinococcus_capsulatus_cf.AAC.8
MGNLVREQRSPLPCQSCATARQRLRREAAVREAPAQPLSAWSATCAPHAAAASNTTVPHVQLRWGTPWPSHSTARVLQSRCQKPAA